MDAAARSKARNAEIESKRARLEEMRKKRALQEKELHKTRDSLTDRSSAIAPSPVRDRPRDIESILLEVERLEASSPRFKGSRPGSVVSGQRLSSASGEHNSDIISPTSNPKSILNYTSISTQTFGEGSSSTSERLPTYQQHIPESIETIVYEKSTQTEQEWDPPRTGVDVWTNLSDSAGRETRDETLEKLKEEWLREKEEELKSHIQHNGTTEIKVEEKVPTIIPIRTLEGEELDVLVASQDFKEFVDKSAKIADRALDEPYDILVDYAQETNELNDDEDFVKGRSRRGRRVKQISQFWDEKWSRKRIISDVAFSPKYPELVLASYTRNTSALPEPHGLVQIWNSYMPSRPEYTFHSSSDVLTAKFSPFHPKLVVGGCYSGQVLLWDTRNNSPNPVQKTPLTGLGHAHPIYSIGIVGTQNANNIISCSTDGVVCTWSVDMFAQPQERIELKAPPPSKFEDVSPQCIAFPTSDPTYFLAGSEEGTIYACHRYERAGAKAGVDSRVLYSGHAAPVMSLDFHSARGPVDLGDLVLSASMDWTVKLWRVRPAAALGSAVTGTTSVQECVLDILREDIVYDVKWSPVRPSIFAMVDGAGALEVWDLNVDTEVPVTKVHPTQEMGSAWPKRSLNRCAWEGNEGKRIAVGGLDGVVTVFEVGSDLGGVEGGKPDEWSGVKKVVTRAEAALGAKAAVNGR